MANYISLRGFVSSEIETKTMDNGLLIGKFRMGSNVRKRDDITNQWVDGKTNWFRVNTFRSLAQNTMSSIHKGDRILVVGKLRITSFTRADGTPGTGVEIDADSIGPDLQFGTATYHRLKSARPAGQNGYSDDGAPSYPGNEPTAGNGYHDEDRSEDPDDGEQYGEEDGDDEQAAALSPDQHQGQGFGRGLDDPDGDGTSSGLETDEQANLETGEISKVGAPF